MSIAKMIGAACAAGLFLAAGAAIGASAYLRIEIARWAKVVKEAGIKLE